MSLVTYKIRRWPLLACAEIFKHALKNLDRFVTMYLDYAESQAERNIPMTMNDWATKLHAFLQFNEKEILSNAGKVTQAIAKAFAESEFEKYRLVQDKFFESDFDKAVKELSAPTPNIANPKKKKQ